LLFNDNLISLDGLENLTSVGKYLKINRNWNLSDLCGTKNLLILNGVNEYISIEFNQYNPSVEDIIADNCSL